MRDSEDQISDLLKRLVELEQKTLEGNNWWSQWVDWRPEEEDIKQDGKYEISHIFHKVSYFLHHKSSIMHSSSWIMHLLPYIMHYVSRMMLDAWWIMHDAWCKKTNRQCIISNNKIPLNLTTLFVFLFLGFKDGLTLIWSGRGEESTFSVGNS